MTMLPVCSTTNGGYLQSQICLYGGCRHYPSFRNRFVVRCIVEDRTVLGLPNEIHVHGLSFKSQAATYFCSNFVERDEHVSSLRFSEPSVEETSILPQPYEITSTGVIQDDPTNVSDFLNVDAESVSPLKITVKDAFAGINESLSASVNEGETAMEKSFETITSSVESTLKGVNEAVESAISNVKFALSNTFAGLSNNSKEASSRIGVTAIDALRHAIVTVENSLAQGATFVVYTYASTKELLPREIQNVLNSSEENSIKILRPVGTTFQQVYTVLEVLERSLGLDPNDPIVPFVLFLGTSATLWISYWILTYAGYAGDLSPKLALELLNGSESVVLVDVRPEDFRERDGIPDLRRAARFRYASVTLPEVDASVRKLLKNEKDLSDTLIATVILNLKTVQDRSKVIVMDADGSRSKGIARSLRKLGVKRPYLVQGGFRSWVQEGLRIKELKPETTFTILNEEAEAILEETTPLQVIGYGVGFAAAAYALLEWEKTLQLIAVIGLGQTIYQRVTSYEDSEDFNQDVRLLLAPVKLGGQAISWAAGKLEKNGNGLPISPLSLDVQSRVLQAAAKHESQPSDSEETQDALPDSVAPANQNVDLSEA